MYQAETMVGEERNEWKGKEGREVKEGLCSFISNNFQV